MRWIILSVNSDTHWQDNFKLNLYMDVIKIISNTPFKCPKLFFLIFTLLIRKIIFHIIRGFWLSRNKFNKTFFSPSGRNSRSTYNAQGLHRIRNWNKYIKESETKSEYCNKKWHNMDFLKTTPYFNKIFNLVHCVRITMSTSELRYMYWGRRRKKSILSETSGGG